MEFCFRRSSLITSHKHILHFSRTAKVDPSLYTIYPIPTSLMPIYVVQEERQVKWMQIKAMKSHPNSSCAACKFLKRRCTPNCIFAPYFRSDEPKKFAGVHKVFGASNVSKILIEVPEEQREDAVNSLAYEAEARLQDPVYGCIGAIAMLQKKMVELQHDLAVARARLARYNSSFASSSGVVSGNDMMAYLSSTGQPPVVTWGGGLSSNSFSHNSPDLRPNESINIGCSSQPPPYIL